MEKVNARTQALTRPMAWGEMPAFTAQNAQKKGNVIRMMEKMLGAAKNEYTTAVMKLFMMGAISRIYYPGCKFDYMLVLVGRQGGGKSSFLRFLALNDDWYNDNFSTLDSSHAVENLRGMWIVELAELQATKRAKDVETIKSFITSRVDTVILIRKNSRIYCWK